MILPTKGIGPEKALLSVGALVLQALGEPKTVSRVWADLRAPSEKPLDITFDWFVLALDLLHALGTIEHSNGRLSRLDSLSGSET